LTGQVGSAPATETPGESEPLYTSELGKATCEEQRNLIAMQIDFFRKQFKAESLLLEIFCLREVTIAIQKSETVLLSPESTAAIAQIQSNQAIR
jgi:hypothetical protein